MIPIGSDVKLSIIIPVYNVEKHLRSCLDSLLNGMSEEAEIVLVDDGAKDGSPAICDDYKARYENIRVIHKENGGLASARNAGIAVAEGRYITFIDSDDHVEPEYCGSVLPLLDAGGDIIVFPYYVDDTQTQSIRKKELPDLSAVSPQEALRTLENSGTFNMVWNKIYRREMLSQVPAAEFSLNTEPAEDLIFNSRCFVKAKSVTLCSKPFYHWVRRGEDTLANRFRKDLTQKNRMFIECRDRLYHELGMDETDFSLLARGNLAYVFSCIPNMYRGKNTFPRKERIGFYKEILQSERVARWMAAAPAEGSLMKQFARLYRTGSAFRMDAYYSAAMWGRRRLDKVWQKIRKRMKP